MSHHTKDKGDLASAIVIADLARNGYSVLVPVVCEHLPFDLIAYKDGKCYRIQCKHCADHEIKRKTSWSDKAGSHSRWYGPDDFDYYALYLPQVDKVVYPSINFQGGVINSSVPKTFIPFYWYEDFLDFTDDAPKRTFREFDGATEGDMSGLLTGGRRKVVERPTAEELQEMLWQHPTTHIAQRYGVTDNAVAKWAKAYGVSKPPRGYWNKQQAQAITAPNAEEA
ncbi:MAG: group I intron-associated PD-(D/E)XK endonuclease [Armatimonadota bacterium]|nr:group I intron-associated PD-(D/E)XK endonuclease [Armatimonadota bacterium]